MKTIWISVIRDLLRNRFFTSVNLLCIVIGLTCSTLLLLYVKNESEANKFFPSFENIYQLKTSWGYSLSIKQAELLRNNLPEIEYLTLYRASSKHHKNIIGYKQSNFEIENVVYVDTSFFNVFQYSTIYGDLSKALLLPYSIVLTQSEAIKIFKDSNPINKVIKLKTSRYGILNYTVTAVIQDIPNNSSFLFDAVLSLNGLMNFDWYKKNAEHWGTCSYTAFAKITKGVDIKNLSEKAKPLIISESPQWVHNIIPVKFYPLKDLHFSKAENDGVYTTNNKYIVLLLGAIGLVILLVAVTNYFNLSVAKVEKNIKQWGIKRTIGASKLQVIKHSFLSTFLLFMISSILSTVLIVILLPLFNQYTQSSFSFRNLFSLSNLLFLIGLFLFALLLFGLFPALITGNRQVIAQLKSISSYKYLNRFSLVIFQFTVSIILIISSVIIFRQNDFMMKYDNGFSKKNIIYISLNPESKKHSEYLEQEFEKVTNVKEIAFGNGLFGDISAEWGRTLYYQGKEIDAEFKIIHVSPDFFELFELEVIHGSGFSNNSIQRKDLIVNQTFTKKYEATNILGASLQKNKKSENVIGIIKDFNYNNLHNQIDPLAFECSPYSNQIMFIRLHNNSISGINQTLDNLKEIWEYVSPNYPFNFEFIELHYKDSYEKELKLMTLIFTATFLSILMGVLGLIGLAYFRLIKCTKEIGIRKVNGAKVKEVMTMLNKDFVKWVVIAFIIACPIAWYAMTKWLENFAYKTEISWWIFALAGSIALVIALLTVSWQSWRAARRNPVEVLRYE